MATIVDNDEEITEFIHCFKEEKSTLALHHHLWISQNLQHTDGKSEVQISYSKPSVYASLPLPLSKSSLFSSHDGGLKYINDKKRWKEKVNAMKRKYSKLPRKRKITQFDSKTSEAVIPLYLLRFTKLLKQDPDPYFDSNFNWYLSGRGNLCQMILENDLHILKAANESLYIHKLNDNLNEENERCSFVCDNKKLIHEIVSYNNLIGLRQKNSIRILKCSLTDTVELSQLVNLKSDVPIASFNLEKSGNACYSCANGTVYVYDTDQNKSVTILPGGSNQIELNNWSRIEPLDENIYFETTPRNLNFIDKRVQQRTCSNTPCNLKSCEKIISSKIGDDPHYVYVACNHNFHIYDIRCLKNNQNNFVKMYSHGLISVPLFISEFSNLDRKLIFLNSQRSNESSIINNSNENILPWHPPSIHESFKLAQKNGFCLDPTTNFKSRIQSSITGHMLFNNDDKLYFAQMNSYGDIFYQKIEKESSSEEQDSFYNSLEEWCNSLITNNTFYASEQSNMSQIHKVMGMRRKAKKLIQSTHSVSLTENRRSWKNKLNDMAKCTDMFANELLSFWEINTENVVNETNAPSEMCSNVTSWLSQLKEEY